jgi:hypothetical protein
MQMPAEMRRLLLGLVGTGVAAANQPASVVRTPTVVHRTPRRTGGTHADRTVVAVVAVVVPMLNTAVCKCKRA